MREKSRITSLAEANPPYPLLSGNPPIRSRLVDSSRLVGDPQAVHRHVLRTGVSIHRPKPHLAQRPQEGPTALRCRIHLRASLDAIQLPEQRPYRLA